MLIKMYYLILNSQRRSVYMWLLGVATLLGSDGLPEYLYNILRPLVREITDISPNAGECIHPSLLFH